MIKPGHIAAKHRVSDDMLWFFRIVINTKSTQKVKMTRHFGSSSLYSISFPSLKNRVGIGREDELSKK